MTPKYLPQQFEERWIETWEKEQIYKTPSLILDQHKDLSVSDMLKQAQKHARQYYFSVLKQWDGYVPVLGKHISISKLGWEHIIGKSRHTKDKLYRFFAFPSIISLLKSPDLIVRHAKGSSTTWNSEFWECSGVVNGIKLEVIITLTARKQMELYSVIWKGVEKSSPQKKELSRALKRHVQGMVTLQLQDYYAKFISECQADSKQYILDMFPYPSGAGLHVGHIEGYTATDIYARFMRMNGKKVLHPMGWDAFGLPAENYAIKTGVHPKETTDKSIQSFTTQIKRAGLSYDWSREIGSHRPDYYRWTQWLFLFLYKKGLAYRKEAYVNWDPVDQTVLANEQVLPDGTAERSGAVVEQKLLTQWFFKITDYADRLIEDLDKVDWPESTKAGQRNWIGKSEGALVKFKMRNETLETGKQKITESSNRQREEAESLDYVEVFTTRHDTIFGATFLVLAPDHPMVPEITTAEQKKEVEAYVTATKHKTELQRQQEGNEKTGVFTGGYAYHPITGEEIPVWIADYVLMSYGSGAVMAVPAHDERDFAFATTYNLPIRPVVAPAIDLEPELHTPKKTARLCSLLREICSEAHSKGKSIALWGGWAVEILVGTSYRDHEDIDIHIRKEDISWWKNTMKKIGFAVEKYPPEEEVNEKFTFVAKKGDLVVDFEAMDIDEDGYVIWLDGELPRSSERTYEEMYEEKKYQGVPVTVMRRESVKWWFTTDAGKNSQRWKDKFDLLMLEQQPFTGEGVAINSSTSLKKKKGAVLCLDSQPQKSGKTLSSSTFNTSNLSIKTDHLSTDEGKEKNRSFTHNTVSLDGLTTKEAKEHVVAFLENNGLGARKKTYRLRDWLVSRQRFWGAPIPIVYKKNEYDSSLLDFFREVRSWAKKYYFSHLKGNSLYLSALKDDVYLTYVGWEHIAMKTRSKEDTLYRLFFLPYVLEMLQKDDIDIRYQREKKDHSEFWECTVVIFNVRFQVILRSYNKGKKHLYSLIYKGEVKKQKKMELSRACIPRSWGIYTPQLQNYCTLLLAKCQEREKNDSAVKKTNKVLEVLINSISSQSEEEYPVPVREEDLPVILPEDAAFKPTGKSPLTDNIFFHEIDTAVYPGALRRESDTLDTFVDSSWYFLRFCDPHNENEFASKEAMKAWMPVDLYMGGAEHTVLHLLYARFFTKVLYDEGYLSFDEPFLKLRHQGTILGPDHRKMSKRWGNVINPLDVCNEYGADTLRMYEMFMGPIDAMKPWSVKSVQGPYRFLTRVWNLYCRNAKNINYTLKIRSNPALLSKLHKTIKKVTEDIPELKFNTAIAAMMEFVNEWEKTENSNIEVRNPKNATEDIIDDRLLLSLQDVKMFLQILAPFAPFITEEIWRNLFGEKQSIHLSSWPKYDPSKIIEEAVTIPVQVNGKVRATLSLSADSLDEQHVVNVALKEEKVKKYIEGKKYRIIYIKQKILNFVVSG